MGDQSKDQYEANATIRRMGKPVQETASVPLPSALSALFRIEKREEAECGWRKHRRGRKPPQEKIQKMHLPAIYVIFSPRI